MHPTVFYLLWKCDELTRPSNGAHHLAPRTAWNWPEWPDQKQYLGEQSAAPHWAHIYGAPISCETEGMEWGAPTCSAGSNNNQLCLFTDWKTIWIPMALNQTCLFPVADGMETTLKAVICDFCQDFCHHLHQGGHVLLLWVCFYAHLLVGNCVPKLIHGFAWNFLQKWVLAQLRWHWILDSAIFFKDSFTFGDWILGILFQILAYSFRNSSRV